MQSFMITLLICSISMSALALLYIAITPFLSARYSEKGRYYAWLIIIIGLIIPFRPQFGNALITVEVPSDTRPPVVQANATQPYTPQLIAEAPAPLQIASQADMPAGIYNDAATIAFSVSWWQVAFTIWLTGVIAFAAFHGVKHYRFTKMVRRWGTGTVDGQISDLLQSIKSEMGITRKISVNLCAFVGSPMMFGLIKPQILLPTDKIPQDELRFILKHELLHFKRKDLLYKFFVLLATALHWFNPAVYLTGKAIHILCETSCDAEVLQSADKHTRQSYGETIIDIVQYQAKIKTAFSTSFNGGEAGMKKRILSIMDTRKKKIGAIIACVIMLSVVTVSGIIAVQAETRYRDYEFDDYDPALYVPVPPVDTEDSNEVIGTRGLFIGNEIELRKSALIGENSVSVAVDDFVMTLNTNQKVYSTTDIVNIWATIEYVGDEDNVTVTHSLLPLNFRVSDGEYISNTSLDQASGASTFERGRVYHYNYRQFAGTDDQGRPLGRVYIDREEGIYRVHGFLCENYLFKPGEYSVILSTQFGEWIPDRRRLDRDPLDPTVLIAELTFTVIG